MKLIDLLARELPKFGGWPEDCIFAAYQDGYVKYYTKHKDMMVPKPFYLTQLAIVPVDFDSAIVTRDQYQSALAASQKVEWSGDGLPPVGCECEMHDSKGTWLPVVIIAKNDGFTFGWSYDYRIVLFGDKADEFRPLRSEADKKRDDAAKEMARHANDDENRGLDAGLRNCLSIYDAIAAGKVPGVKLED